MAGSPGPEEDDAPSLPDLSDSSQREALPDYSAQARDVTAPYAKPDETGRSRARVIVITVIVCAVVLIAVIALILSQTVFKQMTGDDSHTPTAAASRSSSGEGEYVPDPKDPDLAPPPPIFTQKPTTDCSIPDGSSGDVSTSGRTVRGGHLEYTRPDGWTYPWTDQALPYMTNVNGYGRQVENNWYSVVNVGSVEWPESEGKYPGDEKAAVAIFQCYATTAGVLVEFGENPTVTDYRSEETTVDGHDAWIVQATYHFEDPSQLQDTSASIVTAIVVDTDDGPQAVASDVAADVPEHADALDQIIKSLKVV
ncbi:hypothetical protein I8D64_14340 [Brachybacterium sp. MASK1Z-5]|uniref:PknH-like extracellular domain-containing protein n=1 Tax=Brachybacterium halotolerans TaxID=2795215 RepID=A0ABS1BDA5_9MICO|nr:hypothetical protein [Brachybacterium halotolerans]MBK0332576.1 hypothetical protein [Brachybacterium halotolerans]